MKKFLFILLAPIIFVIIINIVSVFKPITSIYTKYSPQNAIINKDNNAKEVKKEEGEELVKEVFKTTTYDGKGILTPGISQEIATSAFWTNQVAQDNSLIMTESQILEFNNKVRETLPVVYDLSNYEETLSKDKLLSYIKVYKIPTAAMYDYSGKPLGTSFYSAIQDNTNINSIKDVNNVRYAVTVKKTSVRSFPTETAVYNSSTTQQLDRFQETGCEPCEPVLILHTSKDNKWYFVQIYNYRGWMKADSIALTSKASMLDYTSPKDFLMVTGKKVSVTLTSSTSDAVSEFSMGTKLFIIKDKSQAQNFTVKLPIKNEEGNLEFTNATISEKSDVSVGYLPYTRYNIIAEAFKLQGLTYDWGDKYSGRDCSSFIMYIHKTFGFQLPRNADEQEICSKNAIKFDSKTTTASRLEALDTLKPGSPLYMPGHTMLYIGKYNGTHYMIHAFLGYNQKEGNVSKFQSVYQVAITTLNLTNSEDIPYINKLTSALKLE